jgi:hypothetical protein
MHFFKYKKFIGNKNVRSERNTMSKIFIRGCLLLSFIYMSHINEVQAMEGAFDHQAERRKIIAQRKAEQQAQIEEKERLAREQAEKRKVAQEKTRIENEKKRKHIRDAEQRLEEGNDLGVECHINFIDEAIRESQPLSKNIINAIWTDTIILMEEKDNPVDNARGVILSLALARYFGFAQGDIDSTIQYIKLAAKHDPDSVKFLDILRGLKLKRDQERTTEAPQRKEEKETLRQEGTEATEATEAVMSRGIMIGAGTVAAFVATWWGLSYVFGSHTSSPGGI